MKKLLCSVALVGVLAVPSFLGAQVTVSPQISFADDVDLGLGGSVAFPLEQLHEAMEGFASFDLFFPGDNLGYWEIDAILRYLIEIDNPDVLPFVSGGLAIGSFSIDLPAGVPDLGFGSSTEFGLKLGGGAKFKAEDALSPWADLHFGLGDIPGFTFRVGIGFTVGG
ncbi:MAG: outer membrane protein [Longimicrobiales bacterium]